MPWNTPAAVTTNQNITATFWNQQIRDNFLVQDVFNVIAAGDLPYAFGPNDFTASFLSIGQTRTRLVSTGTAPVWRDTAHAAGGSFYEYSGLITSFVDMNSGVMIDADALPVDVTLDTGTQALVMYGARFLANDTAGQNTQLSYRISGASTIGASASWGVLSESDPAGTRNDVFRANYHTGLTAGVNTFRLQTQAGGGVTASIGTPWIMVKAL